MRRNLQSTEPTKTAVQSAINTPPLYPAQRLVSIPGALAEVTLLDAKTCAATGGMGLSWWFNEVKEGRAPAPAIRAPRCSRWRLVDVSRFWAERAAQASADTAAGERMAVMAKKASIKAREPAAVAKAQATRKARIAAREGAAPAQAKA